MTDFGLSKVGLIDSTDDLSGPDISGSGLLDDYVSEASSVQRMQKRKERQNQSVVGTPDYLAPEILLGMQHGKQYFKKHPLNSAPIFFTFVVNFISLSFACFYLIFNEFLYSIPDFQAQQLTGGQWVLLCLSCLLAFHLSMQIIHRYYSLLY